MSPLFWVKVISLWSNSSWPTHFAGYAMTKLQILVGSRMQLLYINVSVKTMVYVHRKCNLFGCWIYVGIYFLFKTSRLCHYLSKRKAFLMEDMLKPKCTRRPGLFFCNLKYRYFSFIVTTFVLSKISVDFNKKLAVYALFTLNVSGWCSDWFSDRFLPTCDENFFPASHTCFSALKSGISFDISFDASSSKTLRL